MSMFCFIDTHPASVFHHILFFDFLFAAQGYPVLGLRGDVGIYHFFFLGPSLPTLWSLGLQRWHIWHYSWNHVCSSFKYMMVPVYDYTFFSKKFIILVCMYTYEPCHIFPLSTSMLPAFAIRSFIKWMQTYVKNFLLCFLCDTTVEILTILEIIVIHHQNLVCWIIL